MKKFVCMLIILILMITLVPINVFATKPCENLINADIVSKNVILIEDHSWSMENVFGYTSNILFEKVKKFEWAEVIEFGNNSKTPLLEVLNDHINDYEMILVVSDLWDTSMEELSEASNKELALLVPYYSTNSAGIKHVEDVVNNIILKKWSNTNVYVFYIDETHSKFSNATE